MPTPCILVVLDESGERRLIAGLLTQAGYDVLTVANGDAQATGRSRRYFDLVIVNSYPHESMAEAAASRQLDFPGRLVLNADELSRGRIRCRPPAACGAGADRSRPPGQSSEASTPEVKS